MVPDPVQPDIGYYPDVEKYQKRSNRRVETEQLAKDLPPGFPEFIDSPSAWDSSIAQEESQWLFLLLPSEIQEIDKAIQHFKCLRLPLAYVSQNTFPLPNFGPKLRSYSRKVHFGLGFVLLRGFPIDALSNEERIIAFAGVSSYIGNTRARQDQAGAAMSHITDLTQIHKEPIGNPAFTAGRQAMHTDPGEIIAMFCLDVAAAGGESRIASSTTIYNRIAQNRPDLLHTLSQDWIFDGFGGNPKFTQRPILFVTTEQQVIIQFVRRAFTGFRDVPRSPDIPPMTEAQAEALDALHFMGLENSISIRFEPGDFQFLNNLNLLHAREAFHDDERNKRHLLRIWLRDDEYGWSLPRALGESTQWKRLFELGSENQWFPLEPQVKVEKFSR